MGHQEVILLLLLLLLLLGGASLRQSQPPFSPFGVFLDFANGQMEDAKNIKKKPLPFLPPPRAMVFCTPLVVDAVICLFVYFPQFGVGGMTAILFWLLSPPPWLDGIAPLRMQKTKTTPKKGICRGMKVHWCHWLGSGRWVEG